MDIKLTDRQAEILRFIKDHVAQHGYPPTRQEICTAMKFSSPNAAESHLRALECKGAITIAPGKSRGITIVPGPGFYPCEFCGHQFDVLQLGRHGCPNCEGKGLG